MPSATIICSTVVMSGAGEATPLFTCHRHGILVTMLIVVLTIEMLVEMLGAKLVAKAEAGIVPS